MPDDIDILKNVRFWNATADFSVPPIRSMWTRISPLSSESQPPHGRALPERRLGHDGLRLPDAGDDAFKKERIAARSKRAATEDSIDFVYWQGAKGVTPPAQLAKEEQQRGPSWPGARSCGPCGPVPTDLPGGREGHRDEKLQN